MDSTKVVHVFLKEPQEGREQNYYFGSLRAIYEVLTKEDIGRNYTSLISTSIEKNGGVLENKKCIIRISEIIRSKLKKD